eukprot:Em0008g811a
MTWEETKGTPSEQQGQFIAPDAAIHSWRHLTHTSAPQCSSSGCERMLEHTAHFSSFSMNWLFTLSKGGLGSCFTFHIERFDSWVYYEYLQFIHD